MKRPSRRLDAAHHVARHVSRQKLIVDVETQEVVGIYFHAFELREGEEGLSVNHLEHYDGAQTDQLQQIKRDISNSRTVGGKSGFGVLGVGRVEAIGREYGRSLASYRKQLDGNPSHSEIRGLPSDGKPMELAQDLADEAFRVFFRASDL